ncbi:MAG: pyruvate kinase [Anaerolineaceae bacterium]|jgi:pyruvate kinase|nr:MAG: pyruvate kinase [Anaerolineaceae bacterium]
MVSFSNITSTRRTKIVATLGPSSDDAVILEELIKSGLDVARLNFSHGTHESHGALIQLIRTTSAKAGKPVSILQDLQGPKLRVGDLPSDSINLKAGQKIRFICAAANQNSLPDDGIQTIPLDIPNVFSSLTVGNRVLLDDGKLEMEIIEVGKNEALAKVTLGGELKSNKGVNLPGISLDIPGFTEKDHEDLVFGLSQGVDAIAISFVRDADDVQYVRKAIQAIDPEQQNIPIIAKLELPEAIKNLSSIIACADGVMVARGDLAVETSAAAVPIIQKEIIEMANRKAKLVITATQMLDSMVHNPRPTRAEASDVANAIFDGTDAVMLSGETANGEYPVESIKVMASIIIEAEKNMDRWGKFSLFKQVNNEDDAMALSLAARELANERNVSAVAVFTQSGRSAILQSKARPNVPILAFTPSNRTYQRLGMYWGVIPFLVPFSNTLKDMITHVEKTMFKFTDIKEGQKVIIVSGFPIGAMRATNLALLHTIGSLQSD